METWAEAMRALNNDDENTYMSLVLNVIQSNNTIPVIVMDADGTVTDCRNLEIQDPVGRAPGRLATVGGRQGLSTCML